MTTLSKAVVGKPDRTVEHGPSSGTLDATVEQGSEEEMRATCSWPFDDAEGER